MKELIIPKAQSVLARNLLEVFNQRDEAKRLDLIQELYVTEATFFELDGAFNGYEAINRRVTEVLQSLPPGAIFRTAGEMTANHNVARLSWTLELEDGAVIASGMDIGLLEGNRIAALYLFLDPAQTD